MKSIEQLIVEITEMQINGSPLLINNLFQSQAFHKNQRDWQANLRTAGFVDKEESFFEFGRGATPVEALQAAFDKAKNAVPKNNDMPKFLPKAYVKVVASVEDFL